MAGSHLRAIRCKQGEANMQQRTFWLAVILFLLSTLLLVGCGVEASTYQKIEPYTLEEGADGINKIKLTARAAERLQVSSVPVTAEDNFLVVPYGALIYDNYGGTWIYINPEPLTYLREEVIVDYIEGDKVFLTSGPDIGTEVAITAVAELYGTDTGVGK